MTLNLWYWDLDVENKSCANHLKNLITFLDSLIAKEDYVAINNLLKEADVKLMHVAAQICLLRGTSMLRRNLPNWLEFYEKSKIELDNRGKNASRLLQGLER